MLGEDICEHLLGVDVLDPDELPLRRMARHRAPQVDRLRPAEGCVAVPYFSESCDPQYSQSARPFSLLSLVHTTLFPSPNRLLASKMGFNKEDRAEVLDHIRRICIHAIHSRKANVILGADFNASLVDTRQGYTEDSYTRTHDAQ